MNPKQEATAKAIEQADASNADALVIAEEARKLGREVPDINVKKMPAPEPEQEDELPLAAEEKIAEVEGSEPDNEPIDEYGNERKEKKVYTEEEVQNMIRDRLKRVKEAKPEETREIAKDFKADPASEESWEVQLKDFINNTLEERETKRREADWRQQAEQEQAEFEDRFTRGMIKYDDFRDVVNKVPVTNAMMEATKTMKDPAAFLYAASKKHAVDLQRIAALPNATHQIAEVARLEERMKKARTITSSPRPLTKISGDMTDDVVTLPSIESRIDEHAKMRRK